MLLSLRLFPSVPDRALQLRVWITQFDMVYGWECPLRPENGRVIITELMPVILRA